MNDLQDAGDETQGRVAQVVQDEQGATKAIPGGTQKLRKLRGIREESVGAGKSRLMFPAVDSHYGSKWHDSKKTHKPLPPHDVCQRCP